MTENRPLFLIEDNPDHAELVKRALKLNTAEFPLQHFADPETFFSSMEEIKNDPSRWPGLILLDLKLPRIDGLTMLQNLKNHPLFQRIPVVILSTSAHRVDRQQAYRYGAHAYLQKPVDFNDLKDTMGALIKFWFVWNKLCYE
jgi:DNA-binding response OmpR family regulator